MNTKEKIVNDIESANELLNEGWKVKFATTSITSCMNQLGTVLVNRSNIIVLYKEIQ